MLEKVFKFGMGQKVTLRDDNQVANVLTVVGYYALELFGQAPIYRYVLRSPGGTAMVDIKEVEDQAMEDAR